jgi:Putative peptidoglycan binding domain
MIGYGGVTTTEAGLLAWGPWTRIDPEFRRRLKAMMDASIDSGHRTGIGGSWRSTASQTTLFLSRYIVDKDGNYNGDVYWNGNWYEKKDGVSPAAAPGTSYHESTTKQGMCLAVDMVGDISWCRANEAKYGLRDFADVNGEAWHFQPVDIPTSRRFYSSLYEPLKVFPISGAPTPPTPPAPPIAVVVPIPTIRITTPYMNGIEVMKLQNIMKFWGWYNATVDGWFGPVSAWGVSEMQKVLKVTVDGVYGPQTAAAYKKFAEAMQAFAGT